MSRTADDALADRLMEAKRMIAQAEGHAVGEARCCTPYRRWRRGRLVRPCDEPVPEDHTCWCGHTGACHRRAALEGEP